MSELTVLAPYMEMISKSPGRPLEEQYMPWNEVSVDYQETYNSISGNSIHPMTRTHIIAMIAIEEDHWRLYHQFYYMTSDPELKRLLAAVRRAEHIHRSRLEYLLDPKSTPLEKAIGLEMQATEYYKLAARLEKNPAAKAAFEFILDEDREHGHLYSVLYELQGHDPKSLTGGLTEFYPRRTLSDEYLIPEATIWMGLTEGCYQREEADPQTLINIDTLIAGERTTYQSYHYYAHFIEDPSQRRLYAQIRRIEEQHNNIHETLYNPHETILERIIHNELTEIWHYRRLMQIEENKFVRSIYQRHYEDELTHSYLFGQLANKY